MIQSKIAVGYKKFAFHTRITKRSIMFSELYFWGWISIDESSLSFEGLYLKEVTVPKSYKVIN